MRRALTMAAACAPLLAAAEPQVHPHRTGLAPYAFARGGVALAQDDDARQMGFDEGVALEAGVGIDLTPHLALEAGGGLLRFTRERTRLVRTADDPGAPVVQLDSDEDLSALQAVASLRACARRGRLEVFALAGLAAYHVSLDVRSRTDLGQASSYSDTDTTFGFHAGAGFAAFLSPRVAFGLEGRYASADAVFGFEGSSTAEAWDAPLALDRVVLSATFAWRP